MERYAYAIEAYKAARRKWGSNARVYELIGVKGRIDLPSTTRGRFIELIKQENLDVILKHASLYGRAKIYCSVDLIPKLRELEEKAKKDTEDWLLGEIIKMSFVELHILYKLAPPRDKEVLWNQFKHLYRNGKLKKLDKELGKIRWSGPLLKELSETFGEKMRSSGIEEAVLFLKTVAMLSVEAKTN